MVYQFKKEDFSGRWSNIRMCALAYLMTRVTGLPEGFVHAGSETIFVNGECFIASNVVLNGKTISKDGMSDDYYTAIKKSFSENPDTIATVGINFPQE